MKLKHILLATLYFFSVSTTVEAQQKLKATNLSVNLLTNTERVLLNGYPTSIFPADATTRNEQFQYTLINTASPCFGWVLKNDIANSSQTAYRILVSSEKGLIEKETGDVWDSGKIESNQSINIAFEGKSLNPDKVYYWRVKTWDNHQNESSFSEIGQFKTAKELQPYFTDYHPIQKMDEKPIAIAKIGSGHYFIDFGKDAFGRIRVNLFSENENDTVTIHLGEAQKEGKVNRAPGGTIRYSKYNVPTEKGWNTYIITIKPDKRNTGSQAVLMPQYIGEVVPFRYCEIENYQYDKLEKSDIIRETVFYPFNESESYFHSSDTVLNKVWDICKYSMKATSFTGIYVDGDRERIPYEADALINQLSHYCTAREYNIARRSHEYLIKRPTWPTEWILQSTLIAWADYQYTGNTQSLEHFYTDLQAKTLVSLADENGFISTRNDKATPEIMKSIHYNGTIRDIVDWPQPGESDGYVFTDINTVVNAFHYRSLRIMTSVATLLNKTEDVKFYNAQAEKLKKSFNAQLFDKKRGIYIDGIGTDHASLHANMFALAFDMVPEKQIPTVLEFIRSRKMACSVYGAQFLLESIYDNNDAEYALQLLSSTSDRSWYNMIRAGSTITMEAWDNKFKPNQDWNHAWGAVPANIIPRKLMGIEPVEAGFGKIRIKPQPASLEFAEMKHPTIRGDVFVKFQNNPGKSFQLETAIPANTSAIVYLPFYSNKQKVSVNGKVVKWRKEGTYSVIDNIGSGNTVFQISK